MNESKKEREWSKKSKTYKLSVEKLSSRSAIEKKKSIEFSVIEFIRKKNIVKRFNYIRSGENVTMNKSEIFIVEKSMDKELKE